MIFRISRQDCASQHGNVVSRKNRHTVPGALPLPHCFVPETPKALTGKASCSALSSWRLTTSGSAFANQARRLSSRLLMLLMLKVATLTKPLSLPCSCWFCCDKSFTLPGESLHKSGPARPTNRSPAPTAQRSPRGSSLCPQLSQAYEIRKLPACPRSSAIA